MKTDDIALMLEEILKHVKEQATPKYLTARGVEKRYGIKQKTVLNRSCLKPTDPRYIPAVKLKGGSRKYFDPKVLDRLLTISRRVL